MVAADACVRSGWRYFSIWRHLAGSLGLYAMVGALLGILATTLVWLERRFLAPRVARLRLHGLPYRAAFYGVVGGLASMSTAMYTFSGEHISRTLLGRIGPYLFMFAAGSVTAAGSALLLRAFARVGQRSFWFCCALFGLVGAILVWIDLTQYVSLYSRIHTILELSAALTLGAAFALLLEAFQRRARYGEGAVRLLGAAGCGWLMLFVVVPGIRVRTDDWLRHVWLEEAYVGRVLRREQIAEAFFKDPWHWRGLYLSRVDRLAERFPLGVPVTGREWLKVPPEPPELTAQLAELRAGKHALNVIVYYVDTLRNDVARDPSIMPNLARFASESLDFRHAYAAGSDTLRSLPALTGGNYDVSITPDNDFLRVAARAGYDRQLVIAKSAHEFIGKLRPEFHFDHAIDVEDYPAEMQVWGYGAQQTTAGPLVDRTIEFLGTRRHTDKPFLLWLFNFDQHNWHELDTQYVERLAETHHIQTDAIDQSWRYRAIAAGIDAEFGRLLAELDRRKLRYNTVVLFVSDHGEALGRDGFWVHSVFLWDELIQVPLVLRAPGVPPKRVEQRVSLVDVAPTLSRYMLTSPSLDGYQGEDLLSYALPDRPPRRLPLLLTGASKDVLVRVGIVDPNRDWKLVLSLEAALPELYRLGGNAEPDTANVAEANPRVTLSLLQQLYRSSVFPRTADDFDLRDTKEQKAQYAAEAAAASAPLKN